MAIIGQRLGKLRNDHPHKLWVVSTWRGILRVAGWPRQRGKPTDAFMQSLVDRMRDIVRSLRYQHPREVIPMMEAVIAHNKEVSGLKGSARIRLRDVQYKIASGTMFALVDQFGHTYWPRRMWEMVSESLDWTDPRPGSLLIYSNGLWLPTQNCATGAILTALSEGTITGACPVAAFQHLEPTTMPQISEYERAVQEALSVIGQSQGDLMFRGADGWQALHIGTTGQVLAVGTDGMPGWYNINALPS